MRNDACWRRRSALLPTGQASRRCALHESCVSVTVHRAHRSEPAPAFGLLAFAGFRSPSADARALRGPCDPAGPAFGLRGDRGRGGGHQDPGHRCSGRARGARPGLRSKGTLGLRGVEFLRRQVSAFRGGARRKPAPRWARTSSGARRHWGRLHFPNAVAWRLPGQAARRPSMRPVVRRLPRECCMNADDRSDGDGDRRAL